MTMPPTAVERHQDAPQAAQGQQAGTAALSGVETRMARLSRYWPPLGGVNCLTFVAGDCVSNMASGLPWRPWVGRAAACPAELPFWTAVTLPGGERFLCLDRGGRIVTDPDGTLWLDLLVQRPPVPFGTLVAVQVVRP